MGRKFDLGDILSITTGALVSRRHMDGVYDILNFMTGDNLFTHQLPRASQECEGPLRAQHPDLPTVAPEFAGATNEERMSSVFGWLTEMEEQFGEHRVVTPLADDDHTVIDPLSELGLRGIPPERIIPLELGEEQ